MPLLPVLSSLLARASRALGIIHARLRRGSVAPTDLVAMLIDAYDSPHTPEALPGLRAALASTEGYDPSMRIGHLQAWLADMPAAFDVIDAPVRVRG
jgi:hypothetical protein